MTEISKHTVSFATMGPAIEITEARCPRKTLAATSADLSMASVLANWAVLEKMIVLLF